MLTNWFKAVRFPKTASPTLKSYSLGKNIDRFSSKSKEISTYQIALMGNGRTADLIRKSLYEMSSPIRKKKIIDLGNFRTASVDFMIPALEELIRGKIIPIHIGDEPHLSIAVYKAFSNILKSTSLVVVDRKLELPEKNQSNIQNYLEEIFEIKALKPFHLGLIGCQAHYTNPKVFSFLDKNLFEYIRLGKAKAQLGELEPVIRDGDLMLFNIDSLNGVIAPDQFKPAPSGFSIEEACTISRYAGMSEKIAAFGICGIDAKVKAGSLTAESVAQIIWYFIDGVENRKNDFPISTSSLTEYIVDVKSLEDQVTFWRSEKSNRWWMQVPIVKAKSPIRHRLVPCTYNDYRLASSGELPERLIKALDRFS